MPGRSRLSNVKSRESVTQCLCLQGLDGVGSSRITRYKLIVFSGRTLIFRGRLILNQTDSATSALMRHSRRPRPPSINLGIVHSQAPRRSSTPSSGRTIVLNACASCGTLNAGSFPMVTCSSSRPILGDGYDVFTYSNMAHSVHGHINDHGNTCENDSNGLATVRHPSLEHALTRTGNVPCIGNFLCLLNALLQGLRRLILGLSSLPAHWNWTCDNPRRLVEPSLVMLDGPC